MTTRAMATTMIEQAAREAIRRWDGRFTRAEVAEAFDRLRAALGNATPAHADIEVVRELAERMIPPESADETLARIRKYLENPYLPERTACAMALAAIYRWEQRSPKEG